MMMRPPHSVPIRLKILTPVGTATIRVATAKAILNAPPHPDAEKAIVDYETAYDNIMATNVGVDVNCPEVK